MWAPYPGGTSGVTPIFPEKLAIFLVIIAVSISHQFCSPYFFLLKNWRFFLVITVAFIHFTRMSSIISGMLLCCKNLPVLLWGPFLWEPLLNMPKTTSANNTRVIIRCCACWSAVSDTEARLKTTVKVSVSAWVVWSSDSNINNYNIVNKRLCCVSFRQTVYTLQSALVFLELQDRRDWTTRHLLKTVVATRCSLLMRCYVSEERSLRVDWGPKSTPNLYFLTL